MKALFDDKLEVFTESGSLIIDKAVLDLSEAYKLQAWIDTCIIEMEAVERKKMPFWKRFL